MSAKKDKIMSFVCRFALVQVLAAFLLTPSATVCAKNITYTFANYPLSQADKSGEGIDTISGQITTDGTLGEFPTNSYHFVDDDSFLTITTPQGTWSAGLKSVAGFGGHPQLYATPTQLLIRDGDVFEPDAFNSSYFVGFWYIRNGADVRYLGNCSDSNVGFSEYNPPAVVGDIGYHDPWVIATIPEPSTFILFGIAAVSLFAWRRRRQAA
jgi:hypothetical protein